MRWRLLRLNWAYGIGELAIVVVGVMIALGFEQWNSARLDRVEEVEIIDRLIGDLRVDLASIEFGFDAIGTKLAVLNRINSDLSSPDQRPSDSKRFLQDIAESGGFGWNQPTPRQTTFDEIVASGKLGLIRDTVTRVRIADYYDYAGEADRIEERETIYPNLTYQFVPRETEFEVAANLSDLQLEGLVDRVISSPLPEHVVSELNFTQFLSEAFARWEDRCLQLIDDLEVYRGTISD